MRDILTLETGQKVKRVLVGNTQVFEAYTETNPTQLEEERVRNLLSPPFEEIEKAERDIDTITLLQEVGLL